MGLSGVGGCQRHPLQSQDWINEDHLRNTECDKGQRVRGDGNCSWLGKSPWLRALRGFSLSLSLSKDSPCERHRKQGPGEAFSASLLNGAGCLCYSRGVCMPGWIKDRKISPSPHRSLDPREARLVYNRIKTSKSDLSGFFLL